MAGSRHVVGEELEASAFLRWLVGLYLALWAWLAVAPWDRQTWFLENLLVVAVLAVLAVARRRLPFSGLSYGLIFAFLTFHAVGAHYSYSSVPAGARLQEALGLARNPYDRLVHLLFGLLLAYPLREIALRAVHAHRFWSFGLPVLAVLGLSGFYEMLESWAAAVVDPGVGLAFVGAQGDVWDGQKDMSLAFLGALLAMAATWLWRRGTGREPYLGMRRRGPPSREDA